jgi:hypothetical protein
MVTLTGGDCDCDKVADPIADDMPNNMMIKRHLLRMDFAILMTSPGRV